MKMHPSHRLCLFALAALPARSRTIDVRGNVTHTGNLGSVPSRWLGGSVVRWLGSCANPQPETHASRPENEGLVPKVPIFKCRIILRGQANIMQFACAVAGSVPKLSDCQKNKRETDIHAIRYDWEKNCYKQIPHFDFCPQKFNTEIDMKLFKDVPLLCCYKKVNK